MQPAGQPGSFAAEVVDHAATMPFAADAGQSFAVAVVAVAAVPVVAAAAAAAGFGAVEVVEAEMSVAAGQVGPEAVHSAGL